MAYGHIVLTTCILFQYFDVQAVVVKPSVFIRSGSSAELTCTYDTHASDGFTLEWRYAAPGTPAVQAKRVLFYNGKLSWVNPREGRMALVQNPPVSSVASVRIINAEISDTGLYICVVTNPDDWSSSLTVLGNLTVLAPPPSVPECWLQGCSFMGNDAILICNSSQGHPAPIYSWHREQNAAPLLSDSFVEDQYTGSLMLHNLSDVFAGTYTCKASNELGQAECSINLRMTYAPDIGGVFTGISLIVLLFEVTVIFMIHLSHRKGRSTSRKHAEEVKTIQNLINRAEGTYYSFSPVLKTNQT